MPAWLINGSTIVEPAAAAADMRRAAAKEQRERNPEALLRTESGSMLRTRSGAQLIVDDRRWLLLLLPAVVVIALTLDWLATVGSGGTGANPAGTDRRATAAAAAASAANALPPPLPAGERTVLRRPEEYDNATILRAVPAVVILDGVVSTAESDHIIRTARPIMKDAVVSGDGAVRHTLLLPRGPPACSLLYAADALTQSFVCLVWSWARNAVTATARGTSLQGAATLSRGCHTTRPRWYGTSCSGSASSPVCKARAQRACR